MRADVKAVLGTLNIPYQEDARALYLTLSVQGKLVPATVHVRGDRMTMYVKVAQAEDAEEAAVRCNERNRTLGDGCLVADQDGRVFLKLTAYLTDALYAQENVQRALGRLKELIRQTMNFMKAFHAD